MLSAIAPKIALLIPHLKRNPSTNQAARPKTIILPIKGIKPALIIKFAILNQPGNKLQTPLNAPIIAPAIRAIQGLSTSTPVGSFEIINKLIAADDDRNQKAKHSCTPQIQRKKILARALKALPTVRFYLSPRIIRQ
ncbi:hypothetical protein NIES4071_02690 [Calothrix sp. NIES-4071]|nr:hypothetical protein NIES4071_02690 [Calothrix sp. NIES-4071]BAZ54615.1 hypothetical protein NIES4105_02680 [Calothrix sp. NIES-4105]